MIFTRENERHGAQGQIVFTRENGLLRAKLNAFK